MTVNLGDKVRDSVTNFEGVVVAKHLYLNGCTRTTVQPVVGADGKLPAPETFDEPQLVVTSPRVIPEGSRDTGGPSKFEDVRRY